MAEKKRKKIAKKLLHKYKLIILNEETFEERLTLRLNRLNVFVITGVSAIILIILTTLLIAFTPLREYIPGYASVELRKKAVTLVEKTDSLEQVIANNNRYFKSIQNILRGTVPQPLDTLPQDSITVTHIDPTTVDLAPSRLDTLLRHEVAQSEKYNVFHPAIDQSSFKLFPPVEGRVTDSFNITKKHYGIDLSVAEDLPVKATANGTVIFAEWTVETGYVIILEHSYGLISVYKHNSSLLKKQGDFVKAGEVIAMTGNTGKFTTGPHLHFELWRDGYPINPTEFLDFQ